MWENTPPVLRAASGRWWGLKSMGFVLAVCRLVRFLTWLSFRVGVGGRDAPASGSLNGVALLDQPQSGAVRLGNRLVM